MSTYSLHQIIFRLGICRDRRSCKIYVSCVNFSRKQRSFLHILQVYTNLNVKFFITVKETTHFVQFRPKEGQIADNDELALFIAGENSLDLRVFSV